MTKYYQRSHPTIEQMAHSWAIYKFRRHNNFVIIVERQEDDSFPDIKQLICAQLAKTKTGYDIDKIELEPYVFVPFVHMKEMERIKGILEENGLKTTVVHIEPKGSNKGEE